MVMQSGHRERRTPTTLIPLFGGAREFAEHQREILERISAVLATGHVVQGEAVARLERRLATLSGCRHGVAVNSGTDALFFALLAAGIGRGDDVLVTDFSFVASGSAIALTGARPVFVDVDHTYNMDLRRAAAAITKNTRAVVFVHLYGQMSDPAEIEAFARSHDLILIEDAAQAIGGGFRGRPSGSMGLASALSFNSTKPIAAPGGGGLVLTNDDGLAERVRRLRYHGRGPTGQFVQLGYNSLMPTLTAAVLDWKLDHNLEWLARRQAIASIYREGLADLEGETGLVLPPEIPGATHIYHKFVIRAPTRDALKAHLEGLGVETRVYYPLPLHREPCFGTDDRRDGPYPNALDFAATVLSLPIHPFVSEAEVEAIIRGIREFMLRHANSGTPAIPDRSA